MKNYVIFFLIGAIAFFGVIKSKDWLSPSFIAPCSTFMIFYKGDGQLNVLMDFVSADNNGNGVLTISATYYKKDKRVGVLRRVINYEWVALNHGYNLSTTSIRKSSRDEFFSEGEPEDFLPLFFLQKGGRITFTVNSEGGAGYVFSTGIRPIFFCEKTR